MPNVPAHSTAWIYGRIGLYIAASVAVFTFAETFLPISAHKLTALFAAAALNAFYWYNVATLVATIGGSPEGAVRSVAVWTGRFAVFAITVPWLVRTFAKEPAYRALAEDVAVVAAAGVGVMRTHAGRDPSVRFHPDGPEVAVVVGTPVLNVIETAGLPIEAGCRMGVCGADPIAVIDGAESLTPAGAEERSTLARLGLGGSTRLACQARVHGPCVVSLTPTRASDEERAPDPTFSADPEVHRLVILGNGIA